MFAQYALSTPVKSLMAKRLMATATLGAKKGILSTFGVTAAVATVLLLAPAEEFDDLDCQNHICQYECEPCYHKQ
jgi:hypothetical protein